MEIRTAGIEIPDIGGEVLDKALGRLRRQRVQRRHHYPAWPPMSARAGLQ
jgi:hypothetical protein